MVWNNEPDALDGPPPRMAAGSFLDLEARMVFRKLIPILFFVALVVAGCGEDPTRGPVTPELGKVKPPDVCQSGAAAKAAGDYFLHNQQRRRVKARLADLAGYCNDWIDGDASAEAMAKDAAWKLAFEVELALDPSNPQAGPAAEGSRFLDDVLRLAARNCQLPAPPAPQVRMPCNDPTAPNYLPDVAFGGSLSSGVAGAFGVRPLPVAGGAAETLAVVSRHADASASWATEPNIAGEHLGGGLFSSGTWTGTLANDPSILYGTPGAGTAFDWRIFPAAGFTEEALITYCGIDNGTIVTNVGILTRNAHGLQQAPWVDNTYDPAYCFAGYFTGLYAPYAGSLAAREEEAGSALLRYASDGFNSISRWAVGLVGDLFEPEALRAAFAVSPGPRGTGLSSGFSIFDGAIVQPATAQLEFVTQPCDAAVGEVLTDCSGDPIKVRAFILDQYGAQIPFERLQIGLVATNNNGLYGVLDGGDEVNPVNLCLGEPVPYMPGNYTLPCAPTTEQSGVAEFQGLKVVSTSNNPNAANGGYELVATAVGPLGTFGYTVASATSVKFNINPN
jgi:hypothetical protein